MALVGVMMGLMAVNVLIWRRGGGGCRERSSVLATCRHQEMSTSAVVVLGDAVGRWGRSRVGRRRRGRGHSGSGILGESMHPALPPVALFLLRIKPSNVPLSKGVCGQLGLIASNLLPVLAESERGRRGSYLERSYGIVHCFFFR